MPADAPIARLPAGAIALAAILLCLYYVLRDRRVRRRRQRRRIRNMAHAWAWSNFFIRSPTKRLADRRPRPHDIG